MIQLKKGKIAQGLYYHQNMNYFLIFGGICVGIFAGMVSVFYRLLLEYAESALRYILNFLQTHIIWIGAWFAALVIMALFVGYLTQKEPMISGSGIPQVSGESRGYLDQVWWRVLIYKIIAGAICIFGGLSLGREGPSIQLGAMAGKGFSRKLNFPPTQEKYLLTCGAGAGLAAAFNAPLAGVIFTLEEMHKSFPAAALVSGMIASVTADFISKNIFGLAPVFHFAVADAIALRHYWLLVLLGVLLGVLGAIYNSMTLKTQDLYNKLPIAPKYRIIIPFLCAGVLGFCFPQVLGGGHFMINMLTNEHLLLKTMLLLFVVKYFFSLISFGSGAPGGIFFPMLVLGAYIGGSYGSIVIEQFGLDSTLLGNFIILAMAGYFSAIVRAPITGIVLIAEMSGSFHHLLSLTVVSVIAYVIASLLGSKPIYDSLLQRILQRQGIIMCSEDSDEEKILSQVVVQHGSFIAGKTLAHLSLPKSSLIISIERGDNEIIPNGSTILLPGDTLIAISQTCEQPELINYLTEKCSLFTDS